MASQLITNYRDAVKIYHGEALCKQKAGELLKELSLRKGLIPIATLEFGNNRSSGFVWAKNNKQEQHKFKCVNRIVSYGTEVAAFVQKGCLRNAMGVKAIETLIWVDVTDIFIEDPSTVRIKFKASNGFLIHYWLCHLSQQRMRMLTRRIKQQGF